MSLLTKSSEQGDWSAQEKGENERERRVRGQGGLEAGREREGGWRSTHIREGTTGIFPLLIQTTSCPIRAR